MASPWASVAAPSSPNRPSTEFRNSSSVIAPDCFVSRSRNRCSTSSSARGHGAAQRNATAFDARACKRLVRTRQRQVDVLHAALEFFQRDLVIRREGLALKLLEQPQHRVGAAGCLLLQLGAQQVELLAVRGFLHRLAPDIALERSAVGVRRAAHRQESRTSARVSPARR